MACRPSRLAAEEATLLRRALFVVVLQDEEEIGDVNEVVAVDIGGVRGIVDLRVAREHLQQVVHVNLAIRLGLALLRAGDVGLANLAASQRRSGDLRRVVVGSGLGG